MPLPNGVDPFGQIHSECPAAGFLGNRGILHGEDLVIRKEWATKAWITCALQFKDTKRKLMQPRSYSELFFLDEATALAAGHRPCAECRREAYKRFKLGWEKIYCEGAKVPVADIDRALHSSRMTNERKRHLWNSPLSELPDGTIFMFDGQNYLIWKGRHMCWSPKGYTLSNQVVTGESSVTVITPEMTVRVIAAGYVPEVHPTVAT